MNMYLLAAFLLLVAMLFLVLRPFLLGSVEPVPVDGVDLADPAARASSVAGVERVARATKADTTAPLPASTATAEVATPDLAVERDQPATEPVARASDDVRTTVEAAIAARKAALQSAPRCSGCGTAVGVGDAFCRACGTRITA